MIPSTMQIHLPGGADSRIVGTLGGVLSRLMILEPRGVLLSDLTEVSLSNFLKDEERKRLVGGEAWALLDLGRYPGT